MRGGERISGYTSYWYFGRPITGSAALVHINRSQSYRNLGGTFLLLLPSSRRSEAWRDHTGSASVSQRAGVARRLEAPRFLFCGDGGLMGVGTGIQVVE